MDDYDECKLVYSRPLPIHTRPLTNELYEFAVGNYLGALSGSDDDSGGEDQAGEGEADMRAAAPAPSAAPLEGFDEDQEMQLDGKLLHALPHAQSDVSENRRWTYTERCGAA